MGSSLGVKTTGDMNDLLISSFLHEYINASCEPTAQVALLYSVANGRKQHNSKATNLNTQNSLWRLREKIKNEMLSFVLRKHATERIYEFKWNLCGSSK